jgi:glycosyltransferase involved in cell wall biosynthesis
MKSGRVSVITPCYQHGDLLGVAVRSALRQTHADTEVIIVNDGSTDGTRDTALALRSEYPGRVKYAETDRVGQARARREGAKQADGEFRVLLDADDILEPRMAERCVQALRTDRDACAAVARVWMVDRTGRRVVGRLRHTEMPRWPDVVEGNPIGGLAGVLVRADAVEAVGGLDFPGRPGVEDWDLWVRLARAGMPFCPVSRYLARYRQAETSHSRKARLMLESHVDLLDLCRRDDPRLAGLEAAGAPIPPHRYQDVRNRAVLRALGACTVLEAPAEEADAVLALLALPGALNVAAAASGFVAGAWHVRPGVVLSAAALDGSMERMNTAFRKGGVAATGMELERRTRQEAARLGVRRWRRRLRAPERWLAGMRLALRGTRWRSAD